MVNLFDPPAKYDLPVSLGGDIIVDFKNRVPNSDPVEYEDWPDGTEVSLVIGKGDNKIVATAVITSEHAVCRVESEQADAVKNGVLWACITTTGADDVVAINGKVVRSDGV